jgi:hypothetical protein
MITLLEVKTQMAQVQEFGLSASEKKEKDRFAKRYTFLRTVHDYLLGVPSDDYIKATLKRLEHLMEVANERFQDSLNGKNENDFAKKVYADLKKKFDKEYEVQPR